MSKIERLRQIKDTIHIAPWNWPHGDDEIPCKWPAGLKPMIRLIHGDIGILFEMANGNTRLNKQRVECEAASQQEGTPVILPNVEQVDEFSLHNAIFIDPIFRKVRPHIGVLRAIDRMR